MAQIQTIHQEQLRRISYLLNNGQSLIIGSPQTVGFDQSANAPYQYINLDGVIHLLERLEKQAVSDQKQEAYKGLKLLFEHYRKS